MRRLWLKIRRLYDYACSVELDGLGLNDDPDVLLMPEQIKGKRCNHLTRKNLKK